MIISFGLFMLVCLGLAGLGSLSAAPSLAGWYGALRKPSWAPPAAAFPVMWIVLHAMMGLAGWLAWQSCGWVGWMLPLALYGAQLVLHLLWTVAFFGMQRPDLAFFESILLWVAVKATIGAFAGCSFLAAMLMWPVLGWVTFAAVTSFTVWQSNRS